MKKIGFTIVLLLYIATLSFAQRDRGALTGIVSDTTGAVVPNVQVSVRNTGTNVVSKTVSNEVGQYTQPNLPIGPYQITFEAAGFKTLVRSNLDLTVGVLRVDAKLEVGAVSESVQVTAEMARLETDTPRVGTALTGNVVRDLPLSFSGGRVAENWAFKIAPGVRGSAWSSNINGALPFSKQTLLDGADISVNRSGTNSETSVSLEAVQEFSVITTGYSAEYGRMQGGVYSYVMKSGANQLHGSGYGAIRNEVLNANTFVNNFNNRKRAPERKWDLGVGIGGPVYIPKVYDGRDKTFFYVTAEKYRDKSFSVGGPNQSVPLPEFWDGDLSRLLQTVSTGSKDALGRDVLRGAIYDPATFRQMPDGRWVGDMFPGNIIPAARISKVSKNIGALAKAHILPTFKDATGQFPLINNYINPSSNIFSQNNFTLKTDQNISSNHKVAVSYSYNGRPVRNLRGGIWSYNDPDGGPFAQLFVQPYHSNMGRLSYDWTVSPRSFNRFVLYVNRAGNPFGDANNGIDGAKAFGIPGLSTTNYPFIGWGSGPYYSFATNSPSFQQFEGFTNWGFSDTFSVTKGRHFIKFGYENRRNHAQARQSPSVSLNFNATQTAIPNEPFSGNMTGHSFASFLLGDVYSASLSDPITLGGRRYYWGMFVQDDFKVTPTLTLNLGLRWDYNRPAFEVAGRMSSWNPSKPDPLSGLSGAYDFAGKCTICTGQNYFGRKDFNNFGPRFGFAWMARPTLTIRGSYGIMYEGDDFNGSTGTPHWDKGNYIAWGGAYDYAALAINPWRGIFNWDTSFPTDRYRPAQFDVSWGNKVGTPVMIDPEYGTAPYVQQWNFNIQKEIWKKFVVDFGYLGTKGTALRWGNGKRLNQVPIEYVQKYGQKMLSPVTTPEQAAVYGIKYPFSGFSSTLADALRPYPQIKPGSGITNYGAPLGFTNYQAFQVILNRQFSNGLSVYFNYVYSKNLGNVSESTFYGPGGSYDYYNLRLDKGIQGLDVPHQVKGFIDYELPIGKGRPFLNNMPKVANAILGGWSIVSIHNYNSGSVLSTPGASNSMPGWNGGGNRANVAPGALKNASFQSSQFVYNPAAPVMASNLYIDKSKFSQPANFTLGTGAKSYGFLRGFGTVNEDVALTKSAVFKENFRFQIRLETFNTRNRYNLGNPNMSLTSSQFGLITSVSGNRTAQITTRLDF